MSAASAAVTRRKLYFCLFVGWTALTFMLTSIPNLSLDVDVPHFDKLAHFAFYGVMAFLCTLWRRESGMTAGRAVLFAVLFIAVAGAGDELHQYFIPGRTMDFRDWLADGVGGFLGAGMAAFLPVLFPFLLTE